MRIVLATCMNDMLAPVYSWVMPIVGYLPGVQTKITASDERLKLLTPFKQGT